MAKSVQEVLKISGTEPVPPYHSYRDAEILFVESQRRRSSTIFAGKWRGSRGTRPGKPSPEISGSALRARAEANAHLTFQAVVAAIKYRWSVHTFMEQIPRMVHHRMVNAHLLRSLRTHGTGMDYGCPPDEVPERWKKFRGELALGLDGSEDPATLCAWAEYQICFVIHPLADGCGRLAVATAAWIMLRRERRMPTYALVGRSEFHQMFRLGLKRFMEFYLTRCVLPVEVGNALDDPFEVVSGHPFLPTPQPTPAAL